MDSFIPGVDYAETAGERDSPDSPGEAEAAVKTHVSDIWVLKLEPCSCEAALCDSLMVDTCHYTFLKTHNMYNTKGEPYCKLQTSVNKVIVLARQL